MTFLKNISGSSASDAELLATYKSTGDLAVLGSLYERYMDLVYGVCLRYLDDKELAKDAVMQIFEELAMKLIKYEIDNFKSWLYSLAKNFCLMQLRSSKHFKKSELHAEIMQSEPELHLNHVLEKEADLQKMEKCIEQLSADQKQAVNLFYLQRKCYKEISAVTGTEWNKVRSLIQNGKRNLKICMEKINNGTGN